MRIIALCILTSTTYYLFHISNIDLPFNTISLRVCLIFNSAFETSTVYVLDYPVNLSGARSKENYWKSLKSVTTFCAEFYDTKLLKMNVEYLRIL